MWWVAGWVAGVATVPVEQRQGNGAAWELAAQPACFPTYPHLGLLLTCMCQAPLAGDPANGFSPYTLLDFIS